MAPELLASAARLGLPVFEGYGLSECGSVVCVNTPTAQPTRQCRPSPAACARTPRRATADHGQRAADVGLSGRRHAAADSTAGEIATGDLGEIDADGFVYVRGRLKNLIITSLGRNISPEWVERELQMEPAIGMAVVCGEAQPYLSALISPAGTASSAQIAAAVARANSRLPDYAQLRQWAVVDTPFTFANGLLTANGRPRRARILQQHADDAGVAVSRDYRNRGHHLMNKASLRTAHPSFYDELQAITTADRDFLLAAPIISAAFAGKISHAQYLAFLGQAWHHVRHTMPLLMALGSRLPDRHAGLLNNVLHYLEEETGHDDWILNDIEAAGGDRQAAARSAPNVETEAMVAYAWDTIMRRNPIGFFGMVFVLEGSSAALALRGADAIQKALGLPDSAFSYLRSHGTLDQEHVQDLADILNGLSDPEDRAAVIRCAKAMYWLYGHMFRGIDRQLATATA